MNVEEEARRIAPLVALEIIEEYRGAKWIWDAIVGNLKDTYPTDEQIDALENRVLILLEHNIKITIEE